MIRQLGTLLLLLVLVQGKPATYDQRQDGDLNFHAKLDNILIVIGVPGDKGTASNLFSDFAQLLELRGLSSRNKKVSVSDEEIVDQGKNPVNVRVLRIEGEEAEENVSQGRKTSIQSGESQGEGVQENQRKTLEAPKIEDINVILDIKESDLKDKELKKEEIPTIAEKKISLGNQEIVGNLGISEKIEQIIPKEAAKPESINLESKPEKLEIPAEIQDTIKLEKIPEKFISFGTIVSVDGNTGKVIYNSEKKRPDKLEENKPKKIDNQEKIILEKNVPQEPEIGEIAKPEEKKSELSESEKEAIDRLEKKRAEISEIQENISTLNQEKQSLAKQLVNQGIIKSLEKIEEQEKILSDQKIIAVQNEDTVFPKGQRVERELRVHLSDPAYSKSRMSLKKELPRIDDMKEEEAGDKNEVRIIADPISAHLKPIGDMIENCGPGRIRNRYGICQFDEYFN